MPLKLFSDPTGHEPFQSYQLTDQTKPAFLAESAYIFTIIFISKLVSVEMACLLGIQNKTQALCSYSCKYLLSTGVNSVGISMEFSPGITLYVLDARTLKSAGIFAVFPKTINLLCSVPFYFIHIHIHDIFMTSSSYSQE